MLILRLKQADTALRDGRLDEAAGLLLTDAETRAHRGGQRLTGKVASALLDRGEQHLQARRLEAALADWRKASDLAGNTDRAASLRQRIDATLDARRRNQRHRDQARLEARRLADAGQITLAENALAAVADSGAGSARRELARRRAEADAVLDDARGAADRGDWIAAAGLLAGSTPRGRVDEATRALTRQVLDGLAGSARTALQSGRLDRLADLVDAGRALGEPPTDLADAERALAACAQARRSLHEGDLPDAAGALRLAARLAGPAEWIDHAAARLTQAAEALAELRGGPLDTIRQDAAPAEPGRGDREAPPADRRRRPRPDAAWSSAAMPRDLPNRLLLQVDGAGAFWIAPSPTLTIGPISGPAPADLPLLADPSAGRITIRRTEGDYLLQADRPLPVNGRPTSRRLLADGDRIALSARCSLKFRRPHAASGSAALEVRGARLPDTDARVILLMDRELLLSPGRSAHVRTPAGTSPATLIARNGRMFVRSEAPVSADGAPLGESDPLPLARPIRLGELALTLQET